MHLMKFFLLVFLCSERQRGEGWEGRVMEVEIVNILLGVGGD